MEHLTNIVESILFVAGNSVEKKEICEKLEIKNAELDKAVAELKNKYCKDNGIHLLEFNGKLQFASNPEYAKQVESVLNPIKEKELTNAMLEALAIVAYKQPITRAEVEEVRGVDCTYSIQNLCKLGLIEGIGRKDTIGKPILFATTDEFLKRFSLGGVQDLPEYEAFLARLMNAVEQRNVEIEKPMFDSSNIVEEVPEFLQGEEVEMIE